jgi:CheY-like chemotaxis protein
VSDSGTRRKKTIAVVDDSEVALEVIKGELEEGGYHILTASDLESLTRLLKDPQHSIDLLLLDVQMPEMFGDQLGSVLKDAVGVRCPIHLLSSLEPHTLARRAERAGLDGYICKGDGMDALVRRVVEILGPED